LKRILVLGGGGREYAFCRHLVACADVAQVHVYPGGDAFSLLPQVTSWPDVGLDASHAVAFAQGLKIDLALIGASRWMSRGWADALRAAAIPVVGAGQAAARLERSKEFGRCFMARHGLRTPATRAHASLAAAVADLSVCSFPVVVKTDFAQSSHLQTRICTDLVQATAACAYAIDPRGTGKGSGLALIQEFVPGWDLALSVALDETHHLMLPACMEYKRMGLDEAGINTCGMGTFSPVPPYDAALQQRVLNDLVLPTLEGMRAEGLRYRGFLFFGVRIAHDGTPYLLEYNTRLGDPEAQCILSRLVGDFSFGVQAMASGELRRWQPAWDERYAVNVYAAAPGYPGAGVPGQPINISPELDTSTLAWADVSYSEGQFFTGTDRTVLVTGMGPTLENARAKAYENLKKINYAGMQYRTDIGANILRTTC
jgi:phosphoribosylamine---glycine ligase